MWADRLLGLGLATMLCLVPPLGAHAEDFFAQSTRAQAIEAEGAHVAEALPYLHSIGALKRGVSMGDWYLHAGGFAFRVPDGMKLEGPYRGSALLLVDTRQDNVPQRTTITLSIAGEDKTLDRLTPARVKSAWGGQFPRFSLRGFMRRTMHGTEGVCLSFVTGNAPQLLVQQHLMNKAGKSYIITLSTENSPLKLAVALDQLAEFCNSLLFDEDILHAAK